MKPRGLSSSLLLLSCYPVALAFRLTLARSRDHVLVRPQRRTRRVWPCCCGCAAPAQGQGPPPLRARWTAGPFPASPPVASACRTYISLRVLSDGVAYDMLCIHCCTSLASTGGIFPGCQVRLAVVIFSQFFYFETTTLAVGDALDDLARGQAPDHGRGRGVRDPGGAGEADYGLAGAPRAATCEESIEAKLDMVYRVPKPKPKVFVPTKDAQATEKLRARRNREAGTAKAVRKFSKVSLAGALKDGFLRQLQEEEAERMGFRKRPKKTRHLQHLLIVVETEIVAARPTQWGNQRRRVRELRTCGKQWCHERRSQQ